MPRTDFSSFSLTAAVFPHPPPAQLVLAFASAAKSLPRFTSQTQLENEIVFIAHTLAPNKLFTQIHSTSRCHPTYSTRIHLYPTLYPPSNSHTPLPPPLQWPGQPRDLTDAVTLFLTVKMFEHQNTETLHNFS
ncbi:uncharacterized protein LACBIDRAFT_309586 [Laccaria bicolor S238N-H82]|uniref:Predicted protein n=1 Tax=Laccaria bicolor (strain S238N-H82 / ATCC MYA-4686) TaxID=486041 RepID=B0D923_LACBS|nr:uncharacterized protein LACBIDRAFT_296543 [Laccaria bicolor S238N-H82]XP_001890233.1 uncharacterized protein LACBIDRAFT_317631 [Laccaria bicolor S238N-H82]XP_001891188.1 uncharacterized protein LACBIDRAFT_309586 [Laccaria bicolor S238N-H82]EDQ98159.1 predicted protein [Laccaria bicolor S238N-H82]EDQ99100.1 predicted protein [Laccaria bicolor S238N-H82]EDR08935.1 predicted protein [Laccaria bicolor S238N-H82]|eukprot:XP_001880248.1 predicted protein [Laccaria bicolor S238N-H82]